MGVDDVGEEVLGVGVVVAGEPFAGEPAQRRDLAAAEGADELVAELAEVEVLLDVDDVGY